MLFKRTIQATGLDSLTPTEAKAIYARLIAGENENDLFKTGIPFEYSAQVIAEAKRIESEMVSKLNGTFVIDEGYYEVTTEAQLRNSITSTLLTIATVVADVRIWSDGNPDNSPSWTVYKNSFINA